MSKYKLVNGILHKDDVVSYCPEKGIATYSFVDQGAQAGLALPKQQATLKTGFQQFPCQENCAKFVKTTKNESGATTGRLACCHNNEFVIESEEKTANKNVN
jgi:hypothetical protein